MGPPEENSLNAATPEFPDSTPPAHEAVAADSQELAQHRCSQEKATLKNSPGDDAADFSSEMIPESADQDSSGIAPCNARTGKVKHQTPEDDGLPDFNTFLKCVIKVGSTPSPFLRENATPLIRLLASPGIGWTAAEFKKQGTGLAAMMEMPRCQIITHEPVMVVQDTLESMGGSIKNYNKMLAEKIKEVNCPNFTHFFFTLKKDSEEKLGKFGAYFEKNCIPCTLPSGQKVRVLGHWSSKINHSCVPNAQQTLIEANTEGVKSTFLNIRACREISRGEEITVAYDEIHLDTTERKQHMKEHFGFECACEYCESQDRELDADFLLVNELAPVVFSPTVAKAQPARALRAASQLLQKLSGHKLFDRRYCEVLAHCARICAYHSDAGRAAMFLNAARTGFYMIQGCDGPDLWKLAQVEANVAEFADSSDSKRGLSTKDEAEKLIITLNMDGNKIAFMLGAGDDEYLRLCDIERPKKNAKDPESPGLLKQKKNTKKANETDGFQELLQALAVEKKEHDETRLHQDNGKGKGKGNGRGKKGRRSQGGKR
ncbi:hypothetical protein D8B26_002306 [Coccidioides posadasii str. Silveira]|uniref:Uncharacterized protein n=2 Tax=Coccidioides posadasii TaxID=199306 RepID=E9DD71_COCPS|nr:hypothetical protein CPC735_054900 [Coccidioides posadasii C735 delta SOWgp]EER24120.1 hypothetical protein CPC735_054900 [Coccidioides posadasii C735 delta SOWgp]EFW15596.1 conserved hypothetical protein [Coccidioides posadasii str. Silveira]QVM07608.1 hypothetical protein D8B26_002306 [Coccidioides posadasii str. Silveira]|eukprot:XP_003066265.1 hypothetical protein CPC735_054900 [Coccidioides posadasii C735 delta SOWgp]